MTGSRLQVLEGLVIRSREYGEADRIIIVFTKERGRVSGIAKGVRKGKSSLSGATQLFSYSRLAFAFGRGSLATVTQGETINSHRGLRESLGRIAYASYISELLDYSLPENKPQESLFILGASVFAVLEVIPEEDMELLARFFELRLLAILGYKPQLDFCSVCGRGVMGGSFVLSPYRGGIVCTGCSGSAPDELLSPGAILSMKKLLEIDLRQLFNFKPGSEIKREMEQATEGYLRYYLEKSSKAKMTLREYINI